MEPRGALLAATVLVLAAPASAAPDPLCATLDKLVKAANDTTPFVAVEKGAAADQSMVYVKTPPPGLETAERCEIYIGGTREKGTLGGGRYNYYSCDLARGDSRSTPGASGKVMEAREAMTPKVTACLTAKGWTAEPFEQTRSGISSYATHRYTKPNSEIDVIVQTETTATGRSASSAVTRWTSTLQVRVLNPNDPSYRK